MRAWLRSLAVSTAAAVFLAISGAFVGAHAPLGARLAYWLVTMISGTIWGRLCAGLVFGHPSARDRVWLRTAATSLLLAGPFTFVVWLLNGVILHETLPGAVLFQVFLIVLMVALIMTSLNVLIATRVVVEAPPAVAAAPAPPRFLERLPPKLRGAEVWAVEAEDHYLRLHTSRGQDLILLRLADAVAELDGIEGAQVHRSWWVARDAIADVRRGDGRATLTLKDGSEVPVSRTYAKLLREAGWF